MLGPRLADYLLVLGPNDSGLLKKRRKNNLRANSHAIFPITRIVLETCKKDLSDLPGDLEPVLSLDQQPHNFANILSRRLAVLCVSRAMCYQEDEEHEPGRRKSMLLQYPITDLLLLTKKETPPPGFIQVEGLPLYFSRTQDHDPLIDIVVINTRKGETCPPDFVKVEKPLNPGALGNDLFLCFRRSLQGRKLVGFEPELLGCYPTVEHADFKLDFQAVSLLCFPRGIILALEPSLPRFFTFVLTGSDGSEVYGAALLFYEVLGEVTDQKEQPDGKVGQPQTRYSAKAMCVLSHFPFYQAFRQLLNQLYQVTVSSNTLPLEFWVSYFFRKVPIPRPSEQITCLMGHAKLIFQQPAAFGLPLLDQPLAPLFRCLKIDNVITLFEHCLGEGKIVIYSNSYEWLTMVLESLRALLFPLKWQGLFIPILPSNLAYSLRAPVPFLIGLHRTFLHEVRVSEEVLLVDLDRNLLKLPTHTVKPTPFPFPLRTYLKTHLEAFVNLYRQGDTSKEDSTTFTASMEGLTAEETTRIRVLFLRILVVFLSDYRNYLRLVEVKANAMLELNEVFDSEGFVAGLRPEFRPYASHLIKSQMFSDFVINRVLPPSQSTDELRRSQLLYFDWCIALFHSYREGQQEDRTHHVHESVSVSIWPSETPRTDKTPSRGEENSRTRSRSRLSLDEDMTVGTPSNSKGDGSTHKDHKDSTKHSKLKYFQQQLNNVTRKMKEAQVKLISRNETEASEWEADFGRLDVENLEGLPMPKLQDVVLSQPEPEGVTRCNYAKFPTVSAELFEQFDRQNVQQEHSAERKSVSQTSGAEPHIADLEALNLKALYDTQRPTQNEGEKAITQLMVTDIYDSWFFLRTWCQTSDDATVVLLTLLIECYNMIKVTGVPLTEFIFSTICIFCARVGLTEYFHTIYRLACRTMPHPTAQFFVTLTPFLHANRRLSQFSRPTTRALRLPECMETAAQCESCGHELSGTDIFASFIGNPQPCCPMCSDEVDPELVIWLDRKEHLRVPFLKPATVKTQLQQHSKQIKDQQALDSFADTPPTSRDLLDLVQADEGLFWSLFWWFAARGSTFGVAELPFLFLFSGIGAEDFKDDTPPTYALRTSVWGSWRLVRLSSSGTHASYWEDRLETAAMRADKIAAVEDLAQVLQVTPSWKDDLISMPAKLVLPALLHFLGHRVKSGSSSSEGIYDKSLTVHLGILLDELRRRELSELEVKSVNQYVAYTAGFQEAIEQFEADLESRMASNQLTGQEVDTEYQRLCELKSQLLPRDLYNSKNLFARGALMLSSFNVEPHDDVRRQKELYGPLTYCNQAARFPQHRCQPLSPNSPQSRSLSASAVDAASAPADSSSCSSSSSSASFSPSSVPASSSPSASSHSSLADSAEETPSVCPDGARASTTAPSSSSSPSEVNASVSPLPATPVAGLGRVPPPPPPRPSCISSAPGSCPPPPPAAFSVSVTPPSPPPTDAVVNIVSSVPHDERA